EVAGGREGWARGGVKRKGGEVRGKGEGGAGRAGARAGMEGGENPWRKYDNPRRCALRIRFKIDQAAHRLVVEIEPARIEQRLKWFQRQLIARDGCEQRRRDRMALAAALERVAPPLQPDLPRQRLVRPLAHAGDFQIERVERKKRVAMLGGSKQGGEKAVLVRRPDEPLAMGKCILHRAPHGAPKGAPRAITASRWMPSLCPPLPLLPCASFRRRDRSG